MGLNREKYLTFTVWSDIFSYFLNWLSKMFDEMMTADYVTIGIYP